MTLFKARSRSSLVLEESANVVIAIFSSVQRQVREKPTSLPLATLGGLLALVMPLDGFPANTWM